MGKRTDLQDILENLLGSENVYFQPPESIKLKYPCIIYNLSNVRLDTADNINYKSDKQYAITIIDPDPDTQLPERLINSMNKLLFDRFYTADNLNHYVFTLFY